jgi:predicted DNA-binding transcriptional regulator YafY
MAADGSLVLDHPLADQDWAVRHVLQYGPEAEVLEPAEVRQAVVARLERMVPP